MKINHILKIGDLFFVCLTLLFIGLKLTGYLDLPWFWVLSPIILQTIVCIIGVFIAVFINLIFGDKYGRKNNK